MTALNGRAVRLSERFRVDVPEGTHGRATVERFDVDMSSVEALRAAMQGRPVAAGTYTRLMLGGALWMSDTPAEVRDLLGPYHEAKELGGEVLINGLGLGVLVHALLTLPNVSRIDVVEIDPDVLALVGPHYAKDPRVNLIEGDAYTYRFPVGSRWSVVWHDVWLDISADNLKDVERLKRRYGTRCEYQGAWAEWEARRDR